MLAPGIIPADVDPNDDQFGLGDTVQSLFLSPAVSDPSWGIGPTTVVLNQADPRTPDVIRRERNKPGNQTLAATRIACTEGVEQEQRFREAPGEVTRFTISGDSLALYNGNE